MYKPTIILLLQYSLIKCLDLFTRVILCGLNSMKYMVVIFPRYLTFNSPNVNQPPIKYTNHQPPESKHTQRTKDSK